MQFLHCLLVVNVLLKPLLNVVISVAKVLGLLVKFLEESVWVYDWKWETILFKHHPLLLESLLPHLETMRNLVAVNLDHLVYTEWVVAELPVLGLLHLKHRLVDKFNTLLGFS